ncbi:MAG: response regulator [Gammaproteobacteria bacterium]
MSKVHNVEDDELSQMTVKLMLKSLGYEVEVASSGEEALAILEKPDAEFSVILTDLGMPNMGGLELAKRIRQSHFKAKDLPIIAITGDSSENAKQQTIAAGMNGFLEKPVDIKTLASVLPKP